MPRLEMPHFQMAIEVTVASGLCLILVLLSSIQYSNWTYRPYSMRGHFFSLFAHAQSWVRHEIELVPL